MKLPKNKRHLFIQKQARPQLAEYKICTLQSGFKIGDYQLDESHGSQMKSSCDRPNACQIKQHVSVKLAKLFFSVICLTSKRKVHKEGIVTCQAVRELFTALYLEVENSR